MLEFRFSVVSHINLDLVPVSLVVPDFFTTHTYWYDTPQGFYLVHRPLQFIILLRQGVFCLFPVHAGAGKVVPSSAL